MCSLVYVGVSGFRGDAVQPFRQYGFGTDAPTNPTCAALPGTTRMQVTAGGCSCAIYAGGQRDTSGMRDPDEDRRRHYQKKGWSAAKIERALASAKRTHGTPQIDPRDYAAQFADAVASLVRAGAQVTLLAHTFDGAFTQPFEIKGTTRVPLADYLSKGHHIPEDRLVAIDR